MIDSMLFCEKLEMYITKLGCSSKEVAEASDLSPSVISRYRNGERIPDANSPLLEKLAQGISDLARLRQVDGMNKDHVLMDFLSSLAVDDFDFEGVVSNLNALISILNISNTAIARALNFDASYLSRIRSGQRKPANMDEFIRAISSYITRNYNNSVTRSLLANLINLNDADIRNHSDCLFHLQRWLCNNDSHSANYMVDFLIKLDEFDLDEYISAIHFDELRIPTFPFQFPKTKTYYGVESMKQGELDFFRATVLSKSMEPIFMCSDMPMKDMADDVAFGKKWMFAIAMCLKKKLHLNIVHNLNRPWKELMLGLESWIPIYMTGQVSPYYMKGLQSNIFCHLDYTSGVAALSGECISSHHDSGKYYLTTNRGEVRYYRKRTDNILEKAHPLMEIYRSDNRNVYTAFLNSDVNTRGNRHNILAALPLYTISDELLTVIFERNHITPKDQKLILSYKKESLKRAIQRMQYNHITDDVPIFSEKEFSKRPPVLSLSGIFYDQCIVYTYEEYMEHLRLTRIFAKNYLNYALVENANHIFHKISIFRCQSSHVILSKDKSPAIHFVIRHKKLVEALDNFIVPVVEKS